ncbi:putative fungal-specific transcription factor [Macrophomina phaseolina]|uniref:Fungal-specific transcription factor n=1 Tax=Macrophomina phaseolina TaxID=35725 RepID=A0ABQ8FSI5_9PEZI|nr:putative fungal-specific transcription factor [Macrophomina phaseolina]
MSLAGKADQACSACKTQKRKCDKSLPVCELCARLGRQCDYDERPPQPPSAADFAALQSRLAELEDHLSAIMRGSSSAASVSDPALRGSASSITPWTDHDHPAPFPCALFLDVDCFRWAGLRVPRPRVEIPMDILALLTDQANTVLDTALEFFRTVHTWMPIISKKRIDLGIPLRNGGPDLALLFLAMKLIISIPEGGAQASPLYTATKRFLDVLQSGGTLTLACLQAMVLVALYEYGHAVYPAAWMTIGACVRYADLLGVSPARRAYSILGQGTSWTEVEERRRVWWSIFILDRAVALGSKGRFVADEPAETELLPVNDAAWEQGDVSLALQQPISAPLAARQTPFARLCQSALLVSRASACRRSGNLADAASLVDDVFRFGAVLDADSSSHRGSLPLLAPRCVAWSALFLALDEHCCPEKMTGEPGYVAGRDGAGKSAAELEMQVRATGAVRAVSEQARGAALRLAAARDNDAGRLRAASPLLLDALYCATATFHWIGRESGDEAAGAAVADVERAVARVGERWRLGLEYLGVAELHKTTGTTAGR